MIQIDLITGFLGSGKTTFIKKYARHLMEKGNTIGILENDYGAVNVDMMLLQELQGEHCDLSMVAGACDADCHKRRFKTKLIAMGMSGYDRVLIEPSGIFDVDEFFDVLYEEPLNRWYEIGNVIAIVDASLEENLSETSDFFLASQIAKAGVVVLSKTQQASQEEVYQTIRHIHQAMQKVQCKRQFEQEIIKKDWKNWTLEEWKQVENAGYVHENYVKIATHDENNYSTQYYLNIHMTEKELRCVIERLMKNKEYGEVFRIKGFIKTEEKKWLEFNATQKSIQIQPIPKGQEVLIVIGEKLKKENIDSCLSPYLP